MTGLTIHALRHYDEVGLLRPATVDPSTSYRRYSNDQVAAARLIVDLRWLDMPIDDIRIVVKNPTGSLARAALKRHLDRLARQHEHILRQLGVTARHIDQGVTMRVQVNGCTPVQLKVAVDDVTRSRRLYEEVFGFSEQVVRHTDEEDYTAFQFGEYGQPGFFLLHLMQSDGPEFDRPGPTTFGLLVADLDATHSAALAVGASEAIPPQRQQGMPRHSAVRDESGNWIWLYQN